MQSAGYTDLTRLSEGAEAIVYRARREEDNRRLVLKVLRGPRPTPEAQERFRREHELTTLARGPGVVECIDLLGGDEPTLILADAGAQSLDRLVADGPLEVTDVVRIGRSVAEALARVHAARIIHKDISPANIVFNPDDGSIQLIDFGCAARVRDRGGTDEAEVMLGTLPYMAPEQSGRMNRSVDSRADLYALGATLYHLATGRPPFVEADPLDLVHAHIARPPTPAIAVRPAVAESLSAIIDRLLSKSADDRYQSADGLAADLATCANRLDRGDSSTFELGTADGRTRLRVPEHLYGRDAELEELLSAFERTSVGRCELLLVRGWSGIGKTRLVNELGPAMLERRAAYLTGKYDQYQRGLPYAALLGAIGRFVQGVMSESDAVVSQWRELIGLAAGEQLDVLTDVVPEIRLLVGDQPPPPRLPPTESETRFAFMIRRLFRAMASDTRPLVVFLDDLQWADLPSMRLLESLVTDPQATNTLLIGAYRDNEVEPGHPLFTLVDDIEANGGIVRSVSLGALSAADVQRFVADALQSDEARIAELADVLHRKTDGNPFFLVRLLDALSSDDAIHRDPGEHDWVWDLDAIAAVAPTDNVVDFLAGGLGELSPETQAALGLGALLGERFELRDLASVAGWTVSDAARHIDPARLENMIGRVDGSLALESRIGDDLDPTIRPTYRFAHDRVQQAARALLTDREAVEARLRIARLLRDRGASGSDLFDLVEHALAARSEIADAERRVFAELASDAGASASAAAAFDPALRYFAGAWELLGPDPWAEDHELARRTALGGAEAAYLVGDQARVERWTSAVIEQCDDLESVLTAHDVVIQAHNARNELVPAIERAVEALRQAGVRLPADPGQAQVLQGLLRTKLALREHTAESLVSLPDCTDGEVLAALRIQMRISVSAYYARPNLLPLIAFSMVRTTLRHGVAAESSFGFAVWGLVLCSLGQIENGLEAGEIAMRMNERSTSPRLRHRANHLYNTHLRQWRDHWSESRDELRDNYRACWNGGDLVYAAFGAFMSTTMTFYLGESLDEVVRTTTDFAAAIRNLQNDTTLQTIEMNRQLALCLTGQAPDARLLRGHAYDESEMRQVHEAAGDETNLFLRAMYGAHLALLFGEMGRAAELLDEANAHKGGAASTVYSVMHTYLIGVANAAVAAERGNGHRAALVRAMNARRTLRRWGRHAPANIDHRVALIDAEIARARDDDAGALEAFEQAIQGARANAWQADLALATERAARFHLDRGHAAIGRGYLLDCRHHYAAWGAAAKVDSLDEEFAAELGGAASALTVPRSTTTQLPSLTTGGLGLDAAAIVEASAAISQERHVEGVVEALLRLAMEAGGASRGLLVMVDHEVLRVRAVAGRDLVVETTDSPLDAVPLVRPAIAYAARTMEDVVIDDARVDEMSRHESSVTDEGVCSVVAVPVVRQQRLVAVLYLENDLTPSAFPPDRVATLRALASQAAISLQNARLYESLEEQVRERTAQLTEARKEAETQRDRADRLLENVLPEPIAAELKRTGRARPVFVPSATVLFTDFAGFTALSETMSPEELVAELARVFTAFDRIVDRRGIEKLKTIGDAYMAVGGLPIRTETHAVDAALAALDMVRFVATGGDGEPPPPFEVRVGLHSGPLVAGVIGERRFLYDVWGDTVNVAARMESSGEVGRVNISAATHELVRDAFDCTPRGAVEAKGKGHLDMWFVEREKGAS